jgi:hypothetical protein
MNLVKIANKLEQESLLESKVANAEERRCILKTLKASVRTAFDEEVQEYKQVRLVYDIHHSFRLEELPEKGKRTLRILRFHLPPFQHNFSLFNMPNIIDRTKIGHSDSYDSAKAKVEKAIQEVTEMSIKDRPTENPKLIEVQTYESKVNYLLIEPADTRPMKFDGKDFVVASSWTNFTSYSPNSNLQDMDPSYTLYESKSASAARKFYKTLKSNPDALKTIPWSQFDDWLKQNGIHYDIHHSVWH